VPHRPGPRKAAPPLPDGAQPGRPRVDRNGTPEQVALAELHAEAAEGASLGALLDTLRQEGTAGGLGEVAHAGDERLANGVALDVADQAAVQLHDLGMELDDVLERGEAGAGIVDGQTDGAVEAAEGLAQLVVVLDGDVLGDLEDDRPPERPLAQGAQQIRLQQEGRRGVDPEPRTGRQMSLRLQGSAKRYPLQLPAEADLVGQAESVLG
jgi:hypothetical protein